MVRVNRGRAAGTDVGASAEDKMKKRIHLLLDRLDNTMVSKQWADGAVPIPWNFVKDKVQNGLYLTNNDVLGQSKEDVRRARFALHHRGVDWASVKQDIETITAFVAVPEYRVYLEEEIRFEHDRERSGVVEALIAAKQQRYKDNNGLAMIQGKWRKEAYGDREYIPLTDYVVTDTISEDAARVVQEQLCSSMPDGFAGPALNCGDQVETEEWMRKFSVNGVNIVDENSIIDWQVNSCMEHLIGAVEDRVCNDLGVLERGPIGLGPQLMEAPVWGIDCYTRRNIELILCEAYGNRDGVQGESSYNDPGYVTAAQDYIELYLLPTINMQAKEDAHDILSSLHSLIKNESHSSEVRELAGALLTARELLGADLFRIHPKGTGILCTNPDGIPPHTVISDYLGEVYPPYRWTEKLAVLEKTQSRFGLKPTLPDFYNILMERHRMDSEGYGLLFVDASQRANMGSSCSHSCNANCTSSVVVRNGKTTIVQTTNRFVRYGEELCMDYYSVTSSEVEWRAAICLCGMRQCRGSFLHFSTQMELQQVLNRFCSPLYRFASLAKSCADVKIADDAEEMFRKYGMLKYAVGENVPSWIRKYALEILRFIQYERRSLPCALMRGNLQSKHPIPNYTYFNADAEARCVMESRLQAMVISLSVVKQILKQQEGLAESLSGDTADVPAPVIRLETENAIALVWGNMNTVPDLLVNHLISRSGKTKVKVEKKDSSTIGRPTASDALAVCAPEVDTSPTSPETNADASPGSDIPSMTLIPPVSAPLVSAPSVQAVPPTKEEKNTAKIRLVANRIRGILKTEVPRDYASMSVAILKIRSELLELVSLSTPRARIQQLCDVLVLWSQTQNFIIANSYRSVDCVPVNVYARELGNNISRATIRSTSIPQRVPDGSLGSSTNIQSGITSINAPPSEKVDQVLSSDSPGTFEPVKPELAGTPDVTDSSDVNGICTIDSGGSDQISVPDTIESGSCSVASAACTPSCIAGVHTETGEGCTPDIFNEQTLGDTSRLSNASVDTVLPSPDVKVGPSKAEENEYFEPNEVVHVDTFTYHPMFMLWQLMGWFNAGSDDPITAPNVFGTLQLPLPSQCFGFSESYYGPKERDTLLGHILDEFKQSGPWPDIVTKTFSKIPKNTPLDRASLMGSPFLDVILGAGQVMERLSEHLKSLANKKVNGKSALQDPEQLQYDDMLPPEPGCNWVSCQLCMKWRRVAWYIEVSSLSDCWTCSMNHWDPSKAMCSVAEDYDPTKEDCEEAEQYKVLDLADFLDSLPKTTIEECPVQSLKDIYCVCNKKWFKGKILNHIVAREAGKSDSVKIHFQGWKDKYDEIIEVDSGRIQPVGTFSNAPKVAKVKEGSGTKSEKKGSQKISTKKATSTEANKKRKRVPAASRTKEQVKKMKGNDVQLPTPTVQ